MEGPITLTAQGAKILGRRSLQPSTYEFWGPAFQGTLLFHRGR